MRQVQTLIEVDERGRMLLPLAVRKALNIENKKALLNMTVGLLQEENKDPHRALIPALA